MKKYIVFTIALYLASVASSHASGWRTYLNTNVCRGDASCAKQQATAKSSVYGGGYDQDLIRDCAKTYKSGSYIKNHDYVGLLNCVDGKQISRNQKNLDKSLTNAANSLADAADRIGTYEPPKRKYSRIHRPKKKTTKKYYRVTGKKQGQMIKDATK